MPMIDKYFSIPHSWSCDIGFDPLHHNDPPGTHDFMNSWGTRYSISSSDSTVHTQGTGFKEYFDHLTLVESYQPSMDPYLNHIYRFGTNRNAEEIKRKRDRHKRILKFVRTRIDVPDVENVPYFDRKQGIWVLKSPVFIWRLLPTVVKGSKNLSQRDTRNFKVNDLVYFQKISPVPSPQIISGSCSTYRGTILGVDQFYVDTFTISGAVLYTDLFDQVGFVGPDDFFRQNIETFGGIDSEADLKDLFEDEYEEVQQKALTKFLSNVQNQKIDLATDLAEAAQTVTLIGDAAALLARTFLALKSGNIVKAVTGFIPKSRKAIANNFLAYRYGISPLLSDIDGAMDMLAQSINGIPPTRAVGKFKKTFNIQKVVGVNSTDWEVKISVKYVSRNRIDNEVVSNFSRLGFTNPANVLWELVPFSFVVDWFLPIGQHLRLLTALEGTDVLEVYRTVVFKAKAKCTSHLSGDYVISSTKTVSFPTTDIISEKEFVSVTRTVIDPVEDLNLHLPRFKNPLSSGHFANAIALAIQKLP